MKKIALKSPLRWPSSRKPGISRSDSHDRRYCAGRSEVLDRRKDEMFSSKLKGLNVYQPEG